MTAEVHNSTDIICNTYNLKGACINDQEAQVSSEKKNKFNFDQRIQSLITNQNIDYSGRVGEILCSTKTLGRGDVGAGRCTRGTSGSTPKF
jgi:hypothetical protein